MVVISSISPVTSLQFHRHIVFIWIISLMNAEYVRYTFGPLPEYILIPFMPVAARTA